LKVVTCFYKEGVGGSDIVPDLATKMNVYIPSQYHKLEKIGGLYYDDRDYKVRNAVACISAATF
jgi:hypothetical protein